MPNKPSRPCTNGCGRPAVPGGKCVECRARQRRHIDQRRGSSTDRGYGSEHRERFRLGVMERENWRCRKCGNRATDADHWPLSQKELIAAGLDQHDPVHGRALCRSCHSAHTQTTEGQGKGNLQRG